MIANIVGTCHDDLRLQRAMKIEANLFSQEYLLGLIEPFEWRKAAKWVKWLENLPAIAYYFVKETFTQQTVHTEGKG
jgi:hypothetical protein